KDSKFGVFNFIMGRFVGNYIVAGIQLFILFLIGALFFGVSYINDYLFIGISLAIIPAVFSSFGVLLSQFVRREGTAVMLSILICIPSIFFSGALLPLELLSPLFQFIGKILPLYSVTQVMSMSAVKGLYITDALPEMLYLFLFSFGCLAAAYAVRKMQQ
ncbi:MAG TPA: ABC transporter permease, partial [Candidatus Micrarchaeota archaeon]|nr:ABC transporter permease [Candidatus Micrarchaeota archaeon]